MKKTKLSRFLTFLSIFTAFALGTVIFSGCSSSNNSDKNNDKGAEESVMETFKEPETPEEFHQAMVKNSFVQYGNSYRIGKKLEKIWNGEDTTIAYIGGSITEGISAGADGCYAKLSYEYFKSMSENGGDNVKYVNAGLSGTPSVLGTLRVGRDVLSQNPDIVFIEFAVNDGQDQLNKESYESLIRTILADENEPAIILLFTVLENGYTAQEHMKQLGEYYELPMISVADALKPELEAGRMVWDDYSDDESHPNVEGHKLVCEFIENYFLMYHLNSYADTEYKMKQTAKFGCAYENSTLIEKSYDNSNEAFILDSVGDFSADVGGSRLFSNGWANDKSGNNEPFKFTVTGNFVTIIYKRNNNTSFGKADVYLNGEKITEINSNDKDGWGDPYTKQVIKWQGIKTMDIEIRMADDSKDKTFEILGIAYSQNETLM